MNTAFCGLTSSCFIWRKAVCFTLRINYPNFLCFLLGSGLITTWEYMGNSSLGGRSAEPWKWAKLKWQLHRYLALYSKTWYCNINRSLLCMFKHWRLPESLVPPFPTFNVDTHTLSWTWKDCVVMKIVCVASFCCGSAERNKCRETTALNLCSCPGLLLTSSLALGRSLFLYCSYCHITEIFGSIGMIFF